MVSCRLQFGRFCRRSHRLGHWVKVIPRGSISQQLLWGHLIGIDRNLTSNRPCLATSWFDAPQAVRCKTSKKAAFPRCALFYLRIICRRDETRARQRATVWFNIRREPVAVEDVSLRLNKGEAICCTSTFFPLLRILIRLSTSDYCCTS